MIAADIVYLRPETAEEAVAAWTRHDGARYLAGGTEITTAARRGAAAHDLRAVIDIKRIPEASIHEICGDCFRLGAALNLSDIIDGEAFPLLNAVLRGIADHTVRNRLSLGGNLAGLLPYREAVLPLLLADASVLTLAPGKGEAPPVRSERRLRDVFDKRLLLAPGELVLSFCIPLDAPEWPWSHRRKTRTSAVDYPLVTTAAVRDADHRIRFALAGAHPFPFRSDAVDAALSEQGPDALPAVLETLGPLRDDSRASADYRAHLLRTMIRAALEELA
ncbi:MAG TPA: FAD binding domain-containing protein [Kiritimatiellia bacterium]|nr:FAD binding domain-containing protein [Kiritimatiellia bacterium]HRX07237.1 FAD binding domain-containing protein [Kiritimatiellia bacterium]